MEPQDSAVSPKANPPKRFRAILITITSVLLIAAGFFAFQTFANSNAEKTGTLPTSCELPQLQAEYGLLAEGGAPVEDGEGWDPSTFYCTGDSVGNWMGETFIGIGPQVHYSSVNYYTRRLTRTKHGFLLLNSVRVVVHMSTLKLLWKITRCCMTATCLTLVTRK